MHLKSILLFYAVGACLAAPSEFGFLKSRQRTTGSGKTNSITATLNPNHRPNVPRSLSKALRKHKLNRHIPASHGPSSSSSSSASTTITKRRTKRSSHSSESGYATAFPLENDDEYLCPVTFGGNQTLNLQFDTGSSDLWIYSTFLPSNETTNHTTTHLFDPSKSSTFKRMNGSTWFIDYADNSFASGDIVGTEEVSINGLTVRNQTIELATSVSPEFVEDVASDGILGLGLDSNNEVHPTQARTFLSNAAPFLEQGVLTVDLKHGKNGSFDFGFIDEKKYTGEIKWVDIIQTGGVWEFPSVEYAIGNETFRGKENCTALADTGTTLMLVTNSMAEKYYSNITGAVFDDGPEIGGYIYPCNATSELPDITLSVGPKHKATIPGSKLGYLDQLENKPGMCMAAIQGVDSEEEMVFGDFFMKVYFSVFDLDNMRFGFAEKPAGEDGYEEEKGKANGGQQTAVPSQYLIISFACCMILALL